MAKFCRLDHRKEGLKAFLKSVFHYLQYAAAPDHRTCLSSFFNDAGNSFLEIGYRFLGQRSCLQCEIQHYLAH